jgi:hypothetical protein
MSDCFRLDDKITLLPVVHRSGIYARAVERWLLDRKMDCIAVPLPPSFRESVIAGVEQLPTISMVLQAPSLSAQWSEPNSEENEFDEDNGDGESSWDEADFEEVDEHPYSYVPIDPCQSVIAAIRFALGERLPIRFVDLETDVFWGETVGVNPDCYTLSQVELETYCAAVLPSIPRPSSDQTNDRIHWMASRLLKLRDQYDNIVMLCAIEHWPWLREAYQALLAGKDLETTNEEHEQTAINYSVSENTLVFLLGELPYITAVYEQARHELNDQPFEAYIDGVKKLLLSARSSYVADFGKRARRVSPFLLSQCLKYIRNLSLIERCLTPDMYSIILASKQVFGDQFAIHVAETIRDYAFQEPLPWESVKMGINQLTLPDGTVVPAVSRLGDSPFPWRTLELNRRPLKDESVQWKRAWNPYQQCSWLPEDAKIESFRTRVMERAQAIIGADLARNEKFTTSLMDGLDIRETLRHWYDGSLYVKVQPPSIGTLDCCLLLFDPNPDPKTYNWQTTWFAECAWESTLAFFATDFRNEVIGPGIAMATYGGAMFLYPPRPIRDVWTDRSLTFADTLEDRLIAASAKHSQAKQIALLSSIPPTVRWRQIAKRYGKSLVHVPLAQFSDAVVAQLRTVHVLNGKQVRSYAAHFIRNA